MVKDMFASGHYSGIKLNNNLKKQKSWKQSRSAVQPMAVRRNKTKSPSKDRFWSKVPKITIPRIGTLIKKSLKLVLLAVVSFIILAIVSGLLIFGYMYIYKSNYFMVQPNSILVTGLSKLSRTEVLEAAGLYKPINNLTLDVEAAKNSLKTNPWIERAEITQALPDGLSLIIYEYKPKAVVNLDYLYYIDSHGTPFKRLDPGEISELPIISGFFIDELQNGGPLVQDGLVKVFELVNLLQNRTDDFNLANISEINYDPDRGMTLFTKHGGLEIKIGQGAYSQKVWRLGKVMAYLKREELASGLAYINLDCPPRVTVSYRGAAPISSLRGSFQSSQTV
jgi:cell division protein FtsQ